MDNARAKARCINLILWLELAKEEKILDENLEFFNKMYVYQHTEISDRFFLDDDYDLLEEEILEIHGKIYDLIEERYGDEVQFISAELDSPWIVIKFRKI